MGGSLPAMLRRGLTVTIALAALTVSASSVAGTRSAPPSNPATSVYVEEVPGAAGTANGMSPSSDPATSVYVEQVPAAGGASGGGQSGQGAGAQSLRQLLVSSSLGAPPRTRPSAVGTTGSSFGTLSFETIRAVAGVGTARFVALLVVLALTTVVLSRTALRHHGRR